MCISLNLFWISNYTYIRPLLLVSSHFSHFKIIAIAMSSSSLTFSFAIFYMLLTTKCEIFISEIFNSRYFYPQNFTWFSFIPSICLFIMHMFFFFLILKHTYNMYNSCFKVPICKLYHLLFFCLFLMIVYSAYALLFFFKLHYMFNKFLNTCQMLGIL